MRLELRRNTAGNKRHQYELRAETGMMSYSANNYGPQLFPRNEGPKLLIGVHDKRTGVVRLVAAQQLYQMRTLVKNPRLPLDPPAPDPVKLVGAEAGRAMAEGKRALVSELGSAKAHPTLNPNPNPTPTPNLNSTPDSAPNANPDPNP